jgi:chorismate dehydratase
LLIGDDALALQALGVCYREGGDPLHTSPLKHDICTPLHINGLYTYDLSTLWYKYTGLPFVYALWLSRIVINDNDQYQMFILELDKAKENALSGFKEIAQTYPTDNILTEKLLLSYWNTISYDLTDAHLKGLELYRQYLFELKII